MGLPWTWRCNMVLSSLRVSNHQVVQILRHKSDGGGGIAKQSHASQAMGRRLRTRLNLPCLRQEFRLKFPWRRI